MIDHLRAHLFKNEPFENVRPLILEELKRIRGEIAGLTPSELAGSRGDAAATSLTSALIHFVDDINESAEPILAEILELAVVLDRDPTDKDLWRDLLAVLERV